MVSLLLCFFALVSLLFAANISRVFKYQRGFKALGKSKFSSEKIGIVIPIYGVHENFADCLESWIWAARNHACELIFSAQDPNDLAISLTRNRIAAEKFLSAKIICNPIRPGFTGKTSNLFHGVEATDAKVLIFSDADILWSEKTVADILERLSDQSSFVSCLPLHIGAKNLWSQIYQYAWNSPLVCLWAPAMISGNAPGVAGGMLGFNRTLLEKIGGLQNISGYLTEDLVFGSLAKNEGAVLKLGPSVLSKVTNQSFKTLLNNLFRAHLTSIHFNRTSRYGGFLGLLVGYSYTLLPLFFVFQPWLIQIWLTCTAIRFLFLTLLKTVLHGKVCFDFSFLVGDPLIFGSYFVALFRNQVCWGSQIFKIGPQTKIEVFN